MDNIEFRVRFEGGQVQHHTLRRKQTLGDLARAAAPQYPKVELAIFEPPDIGMATPRQLRLTDTVGSLGIIDEKVLEVARRMRPMQIVLFDNSVTVAEVDIIVIARIAILDLSERFMLSPAADYNLRSDDGHWVSSAKPLYEQEWILEKRDRWHLSRQLMTVDDFASPEILHTDQAFHHARELFLRGNLGCLRSQSIALAALLLQVMFGNYTPAFAEKGAIGQHSASITPLPWKNQPKLEAEIGTEWRKLVGMTKEKTKYRFVRSVRYEKLYGFTCFRGNYVPQAVPRSRKFEAILGISKNSVVAFDIETLCPIEERNLRQLVLWEQTYRGVALDWGNMRHDMLQFETHQGEEIVELVRSYLELFLRTWNPAWEEKEYAHNCVLERIP